MGVPNDFMLRVVTHVGNYGEVFDRNLGAGSQFELERGQNASVDRGRPYVSASFPLNEASSLRL
jgi:general L-amino acid transport system substrate-binding protein